MGAILIHLNLSASQSMGVPYPKQSTVGFKSTMVFRALGSIPNIEPNPSTKHRMGIALDVRTAQQATARQRFALSGWRMPSRSLQRRPQNRR